MFKNSGLAKVVGSSADEGGAAKSAIAAEGVLFDVVVFHSDGKVVKSETIYRLLKAVGGQATPDELAVAFNDIIPRLEKRITPGYVRAYMGYLQKRNRVAEVGEDTFQIAEISER